MRRLLEIPEDIRVLWGMNSVEKVRRMELNISGFLISFSFVKIRLWFGMNGHNLSLEIGEVRTQYFKLFRISLELFRD